MEVIAPEKWTDLAQLNPEFLQLLPSLPPPPPQESSVLELREMIAHQAKDKNPKRAAVLERDITIPAKDGYSIPARVYKPQSRSFNGHPLVVMFHGGGFCVGGLYDEEENCRNFSERLGCICVNVEYRLAPEHVFPAAVNDAWDSLQWVASHASELEADPSKGFLVGGTSAGSNLATVVSLMARDEKLSPALTGIMLLLPSVIHYKAVPAKWKPLYKSLEQNRSAPILSAETIDKFMDGYQPDHSDWHFNPFNHPDGQSGLPPVVLQVTGLDPIRDEGLLYEKLLREEYSVKTKLETYPGVPHMFFAFFPNLIISQKFVEDTVAGAEWLLQ